MTPARMQCDRRSFQPMALRGHLSQSRRFEYGVTPFYFLRHGETPENRAGILQGQNETELNGAGRRMAEAAADLVLNLSLGSIYASPLKRAWKTALIVSEVTGVPVHLRSGLMERHWGAFQGQPKADRPLTPNPETVETLEDFHGRVTAAMASIAGPPPVLVVAHSGVFRAICETVGIVRDHRLRLPPGRITRFEPPAFARREWRISLLTATAVGEDRS